MNPFFVNLKENCQSICEQLKIEKYDLFGVITEQASASSQEGKPFALNASFKSSVTLRVWNQENQIGVTHTSNLTLEGLQTAFKMAHDAAKYWDKSTVYDFSPRCLEKEIMISQTNESETASIQTLSQLCSTAEKAILQSHPAIKSVPYNKVGHSFSEQFYLNSNGAFQYQNAPTSYCYFYPLAQQEGKIPRQMGEFEDAEKFSELNVMRCAQKAVEKTAQHLNYAKISTGKYPVVIFSAEAFLALVHSFSNFFNAQNILDKKSLCTKESLNNRIACDFLNIVDSPLDTTNKNKSYFDGEGTPTASLTILENGVLNNLVHTSYTAKLFDTMPTGHSSLGSKLNASPHYLKIFPTPNVPQNIKPNNISSQGIYIDEVKALHAGINALQGSFSLPFDGFVINGNNIVSIESATVAGDFLDVLRNIVFMGENEKSTPSGVCCDVWVTGLAITGN